jgi:eukaryotic-like serine/threonine-protein kinase
MGSPANICAICGAKYEVEAIFCPRDGAPLGSAAPRGTDLLLGLELPGQIRIEKLIGMGSMGRVYRGFQAGVERSVAVKILHGELSTDRTLVARFHREARIASLLAHPNVVEVFMTGQLTPDGPGSGGLYIIMEHVDGLSLRSALAAATGALPLVRALRIMLQVCDAVGEAHGRGVVHRDLKPENVMLLRRERDSDFVKVLDFGIARLPEAGAPTVTQAGLIFGTARYISPEGAMGSPVDRPADVYAIATILYQALAGRTPFEGDSAVDVLAKQINEAPPSLRGIERASYVPEPIASVIMKNLAKRPEQRSPDARALGRALLEAARESGFAPEALVVRSALLGESMRQPAFVSAERTKQQEFTIALAEKIDAPPARPSFGGKAPSTRGALFFLLGCVAGGAGLAAVGSRFRDSRPESAAPRASGHEAQHLAVAVPQTPAIATADGGHVRTEAGPPPE